MNNVKDYLKKIQTSDLSFETQQKALLELEKSIQEAKDKLVQKEVKVTQNVEYIVSAFKKIEDKINKKYEEILNVSIQKGEKGEQGPAGKNGKDGANGLSGKNGIDGKDGADGKDGVSVVDAYIDFDGSLVIKLSDGTEIDAGNVVSEAVAKEFNTFMTRGDILPAQTDNSGKYLTTDGTTLSWDSVDSLPSQAGNSGKYLTTDGTDPSWATAASAAAGSDTQVQFNDGGTSFGGDAGLAYNKTTGKLTVGGKTVTTSNPVLDASQTWNAAGVTFTALKFNATDTASAAGSLLMDLQVGGVSQLSVNKTGDIATGGGVAQKGNIILPRASFVKWLVSNTTIYVDNNALSGAIMFGVNSGNNWGAVHSGGFRTQLANSFSWSATSGSTTAADLALFRDAANTLAQRNSTNAQTFRVYNTFTDASNYERGKMEWSSNVLRIGTEKAGTGTARSLELQTDGTTRLTLATNGRATFSDSITVPSGNYYLVSVALGANTGTGIWHDQTAGKKGVGFSSEGAWLGSINLEGFLVGNAATSAWVKWGTTSSFPALKRSTTSLQARLADDSAFTNIQGKLTTETAYTAGAPTATGYLVLYDSNGTAYKVPAEAL